MAIAGSLERITANEIQDGAVINDKLGSDISITNAQLAGSIANSKLVNDSVTVNGTSIDLGASETITAGKVLQVLQAVKTDTFSTTSGSKVDVTGLSVAITPSSSSNKVLITARLNIGLVRTAPYLYPIFLLRGSTEICIHDSASNRTRATTGGQWPCTSSDPTVDYSIEFLDSPSTTSATTYKIQIFSESGGTAYVNRGNEADGDSAITGRFTSVITAMEIAG
tara:strand:- start:2299 stop:2970 length:672 start_codon:yes stop_codon:yes gene_type:complete